MESTNNFDLNLYEGTDKFNPLLVENENMEIVDSVLYQLMLKTCEPATEIKSGSVHAITRTTGEAPLFRYTATSNWSAGDTMTIDGTQVSVFLTSGEALGTGAYVIGTEVLGAIVGTRVTLFCVSGTVTEAENALNLDGHPADYFGTAEGVQSANALASAANQISIANQQRIIELDSDLHALYKWVAIDITSVAGDTVDLTSVIGTNKPVGYEFDHYEILGVMSVTNWRYVSNLRYTSETSYIVYCSDSGSFTTSIHLVYKKI